MTVCYIFVKNMWYAKQKQLGAVKKNAAKLSRIISITGKIKNWYQIAANKIRRLTISYDFIKTAGFNKDWYQLAAQWIIAGLGNAVCN